MEKPEKNSKKNTFLQNTGVFMIMLVATTFGSLVNDMQDPLATADNVAEGLNEVIKTPMQIDEVTTLVKIYSGVGMVVMEYEIEMEGIEIDWLQIEESHKDQWCSREQMQEMFAQDINLKFTYFDKDRQSLANININPEDCVGYEAA